MLKNESARNATKPMPLRLSRLPDSGGIFTSSNGVHMEKISRSVRKVKQAKKGMTVQFVQSTWHVRTADVAAPEGNTWQVCTGDTWHHQDVTRVIRIWHIWRTVRT
jgi:hypothetical protein